MSKVTDTISDLVYIESTTSDIQAQLDQKGTVTSVTAGNGMTQSGTNTVNPTLDIVTHAGTAGSIGTINVGADAIGVNLGATSTTACSGADARLSDARTPLSHTHGNITNAGAIGTTASLPVITATSGVLTTGAFGTTAGTFAAGDHTHSTYAPVTSPTFTGTPAAPTATVGTNTTQLATTEYVIASEKTQGVLAISYTLADGTAGAATVANTVTKYPFNTIGTNTITGASMTTSTITLPAGNYLLDYSCRTNSSGGTSMFLNDGTTDRCFATGTQDTTYAAAYSASYTGYLSLSATTNVEIRFKCSAAGTLGNATGVAGYSETHGVARFVKVG